MATQTLIFFQSDSQETRLVSGNDGIQCMMKSSGKDAQQWELSWLEVQYILSRIDQEIVTARSSKYSNCGLIRILNWKNWLYSHHLFDSPEKLKAAVIELFKSCYTDHIEGSKNRILSANESITSGQSREYQGYRLEIGNFEGDDFSLVFRDPENNVLWGQSNYLIQEEVQLFMEEGGNCVFYDEFIDETFWRSETGGNKGAYLLVNEGWFGIYSQDHKELWYSNDAPKRVSDKTFEPKNILKSGETLNMNDKRFHGDTQLVMQTDGNIVLYQGEKPIWDVGSGLGIPPDSFTLEKNGNLVLKARDEVKWESRTTEFPDSDLVIEDGYMALQSKEGKILWFVGTRSGNELGPNQAMGGQAILRNGEFSLCMQNDGNLVYSGPGKDDIIWSSGTAYYKRQYTGLVKNQAHVHVDKNGNMIMKGNPRGRWSTATEGSPNSKLILAEGCLKLVDEQQNTIWDNKKGTRLRYREEELKAGNSLPAGIMIKSEKYMLGINLKNELVVCDHDHVVHTQFKTEIEERFDRLALEKDGNLILYKKDKDGNEQEAYNAKITDSLGATFGLDDFRMVVRNNQGKIIWSMGRKALDQLAPGDTIPSKGVMKNREFTFTSKDGTNWQLFNAKGELLWEVSPEEDRRDPFNRSTPITRMQFTSGGHFEMVDTNRRVRWTSGPYSKEGGKIVFEEDRLCQYKNENELLWDSKEGRKIEYLSSNIIKSGEAFNFYTGLKDGEYMLDMQGDENLVLYDGNRDAVWSSGRTVGIPGEKGYMNPNGNFEILNSHGEAKWSTGTDGNPGAFLKLEKGVVKILSKENKTIWRSDK